MVHASNALLLLLLFSSTALGLMLLISAGLCGYNYGEDTTKLKVNSIFMAAL